MHDELKPIAVVTFEMPERCTQCPCCSDSGDYKFCNLTQNSITHEKAYTCVQPWCPVYALRPALPQQKPELPTGTRPCVFGASETPAIFHKWTVQSTDNYQHNVAIVELSNGTIFTPKAEDIKFTDKGVR